ncbi:hypothetical protein DYB30_004269 [Aphanomyces astaci]|uniref:Lysophospholipid acyltransferase n=1 Tax=Aphanomyces astaci TaxID=112090 RepID=A0A397DBQ5_APHAT|nr:hypothetical protein DYB36_000316 [Aphanomyces astaci]RHY55345.1 hypothetical protein DYB34_000150 [Aphanomyces astaci]RHY62278.1 hypothetical protein DYB30_004269 [Aphanomyces astaci]RHY70822.1 hypothetical protein DYB38_000893 [Aphanomyces astaci]
MEGIVSSVVAGVDQGMAVIQPILQDLSVYAELLTPLKFEAANAYLATVADAAGLPLDQVRYVSCLFGAYPFALVFSLLPSATLKHLFSLGVGVSLAQFVFGASWVHTLIMALSTYLLVVIAPAKYAPRLVFVWNMLYISASHLYRLYVDYMGWSLDITGPQMLLVIKLTAFAYNYFDGVVDIKRLNTPTDNKALASVYASRKSLSIPQLPSLLEFFAYVYCFPTFLAGPAFEIREYLDVVNGVKKLGPGCTLAAISKLLVGVFFMVLMVVFGGKYPITLLYSKESGDLPWYQHVATLYITLFFVKSKYYSAWKIAEGATVLCGFGFEGVDAKGGSKGWNLVSNMDVLGFELPLSLRDASRAWNKGTQNWLERYVYSRTNNSLTATYFVSAFWHGFYPGYYIFFMSVPMATNVGRLAFKRVRPWFLQEDGKTAGPFKAVYDVVGGLASVLALHYLVIPFQALSWENSLQALSNLKFSGHIILAVLYVLFHLVPVRKLKSAKKTE